MDQHLSSLNIFNRSKNASTEFEVIAFYANNLVWPLVTKMIILSGMTKYQNQENVWPINQRKKLTK